MASWLPKSRTARRRLYIVAAVAPILILAVGLSFFAMGNAVSLFLTPSQAMKEANLAGRTGQLGGLVQKGSVVQHPGDVVEFTVADNASPTSPTIRVTYKGVLPDLFREGQGVVTKGVFEPDGRFTAKEVLAKHDEKYMPREVTKQLKKSGEWRPEAQQPAHGKPYAYGSSTETQ